MATNKQILYGVLIGAALVLLVTYMLGGFGSKSLTVINGGQPQSPGAAPITLVGYDADCAYAPTIAIAGKDAIIDTTAATPTTVNYFLNGVYYGTSAPAVKKGDKWQIIGDLSLYLATQSQEVTVGCGAQTIQTKHYKYANATVSIKDDILSSTNTLTNSATGATNATLKTGGQTYNFPVYLVGTSQKSTSSIMWVFESPASYGVNISKVSASCNGVSLEEVSIPSPVAAANAGSLRVAFRIPAIVDSVQKDCNLQIVPIAGGTFEGVVRNTFYAEQVFVNADGNVQTGIYDTTPDGANTAKYQDTYTYLFSIR